jgi:hypothetical protein
MPHRAVYKTTTAEFLDEFYSGASRSRDEAFEDASALLESDGSLLDAARELEGRAGGIRDGSTDAFGEFWLAESGTRAGKSVDRVLRCGYREAVSLARERGIPIETFWITGAGDDFELHICESSDRVVVFMVVPGEDDREYGSRLAQSRSWVVRVGDLPEVRPDAPRTVLDGDGPPVLRIQVSGPLDARSGA